MSYLVLPFFTLFCESKSVSYVSHVKASNKFNSVIAFKFTICPPVNLYITPNQDHFSAKEPVAIAFSFPSASISKTTP